MGLFKKKQPDVPARRRVSETSDITSNNSRSDTFRRGRTIVGTITSIKSHDQSSNSNKSLAFDSPRTHVHHLSIKRRKLSGLLSVSVLSIIALWLILTNLTASIVIGCSNTDINKAIDEKTYIQSINAFLDANPLSRLSFLIDSKSLNEYISVLHPEIQNIKRHGNTVKPGETDFVITLRTPVAGWKMKNQQFYVDANGVSFEKNYFVDPGVQIVDNSGISPQSGVAIASKRFLGFVGHVVSLSKNNGYNVVQAVLPKNTTRELDIYLKDKETYIKFNVDRGAGEQVEDMSNALKHFTLHGLSPKYIDVRVSGKAFYK